MAETYTVELENGYSVDFDHMPNQKEIEGLKRKVGNIDFDEKAIGSMSKGLVGAAAKTAGLPFRTRSAKALDLLGEGVTRSVVQSGKNMSKDYNPLLGATVEGLGESFELTPKNLSLMIGSEFLPTGITPLPKSGLEKAGAYLGDKFNLGTVQKGVADAEALLNTEAKVNASLRRAGKAKLGQDFLEKTDLPFDREEAYLQSADKIDELENKIQITLSDAKLKQKYSGNMIKRDDILKEVDAEIEELKQLPTRKEEVEALQKVRQDFVDGSPEEADVEFWNKIKRKYHKVNKKEYLKESSPAKKEAEMALAAGMRREIENVVPQIKKLNEKQGLYLQIADQLGKILDKTTKKAGASLSEVLREAFDEKIMGSARKTLRQRVPVAGKMAEADLLATPSPAPLSTIKIRKDRDIVGDQIGSGMPIDVVASILGISKPKPVFDVLSSIYR